MQAVPQRVCPMGQPHIPLLHAVWPLGQAWPHDPQLALSDERSVHQRRQGVGAGWAAGAGARVAAPAAGPSLGGGPGVGGVGGDVGARTAARHVPRLARALPAVALLTGPAGLPARAAVALIALQVDAGAA